MSDLENVKNMLQYAVSDREKAKTEWKQAMASGDDYYVDVYKKIYIKFRSRFNGMCDILFEMGYIVFVSDDNVVRVENRRKLENVSPYDEIPF